MIDAGQQYSEKELRQIEKQFKKEYAQAAKELERKQAKFMKAYSAERAERLKALDNTPEAKKAFDDWCRTQATIAARNSQMINSYAEVCTQTNLAAMERVSSRLPGIFAHNYNFAAKDVTAQTGVSFSLVNEKAVKRLVKEQPRLLPLTKAELNTPKDLLWNRKKMTSAVVQGILQGESNPQIAKRLRSVTDMNQRSAIAAARTAVTGAENGGRFEMFKQAEDMGIEIVKIWMATNDANTRESHALISGEEQPLDKEFSNGCMFPGDPSGEPAEVYNCRCTMGNRASLPKRKK